MSNNKLPADDELNGSLELNEEQLVTTETEKKDIRSRWKALLEKKWFVLFLIHSTLLFMQITWASNTLISKYALLNGISPGMYQTLRALMSAPFLVVAAVFVDGKKFIPSRKMEFAHFALIGLFGIALNGILYSAGLQLSPPKIAGILQPGTPCIAFVISVILRREKANIWKVIGLLTAISGGLVVLRVDQYITGTVQLSSSDAYEDTSQVVVGTILFLISFVTYALYLILQKPVLERVPPLTTITWAVLFGSIPCVIYTVITDYDGILALPNHDLKVWGSMSYASLLSLGLAYVLGVFVMRSKEATPTMASSYGCLMPVLVAVESVIFLDATIKWYEFVGGMLTIAGLAFLVFGRRRELKQQQQQAQFTALPTSESNSSGLMKQSGSKNSMIEIDKSQLGDGLSDNVLLTNDDVLEEENENQVELEEVVPVPHLQRFPASSIKLT